MDVSPVLNGQGESLQGNIDFLPRNYVARISNSYSCVFVRGKGTGENQERNCLEFNRIEKSVQEFRCRPRRFSPIIFLIPEFTFIEKRACLFAANYFKKNFLVAPKTHKQLVCYVVHMLQVSPLASQLSFWRRIFFYFSTPCI